MKKSKFQKICLRLRKIIVQETMDGCCDCIEAGALCRKHEIEVSQMWRDPKHSQLAEEAKRIKG